jgi:hypothetical protein
MYDSDTLQKYLSARGYQRVFCEENWGSIVLKKYGRLIEQSTQPVADMRCPLVYPLLKEQHALRIPEIEPILIHCAREICGRAELADQEKVITTPCRSLADMGNQIGFKDTRFLSWKDFVGNDVLPHRQLDASPIPPGYFSSLDKEVFSVTGETQIRSCLENRSYGSARMIEMLFCEEGCHHGDGVIGLE